MPTATELEHRAEIEFEKLGVAEHLGWWLAGFVALATHLKWDNWLFTVAAFVIAYLATTFPYKKRHASAKAAADNAHRGNAPSGPEANDAV